jgi:hypothetical protein
MHKPGVVSLRPCLLAFLFCAKAPLAGLSESTWSGMAAEQEAPPAYFAGTSAEFQATADVLLQLQSGVQLPAHSVLLASASPVLCDVLDMAVGLVEAGSKALLPLDDVTEQEAVDILKARTC